MIHSENGEIKKELVSDARVKRPRLEYQGDWQWDKDDSYYRSKIQFSDIISPIVCQKCIRGFQGIF
jgi:hypothetical protein